MVALAAVATFHLGWTDPALRQSRADAIAARDQAVSDKDAEHAAHLATIASYRAAAAVAEAQHKATVARVATEQFAITERIGNDYQARLGALRDRADRLALQLRAAPSTAADPGLSGGAGLSGAGAPAGGPDAASAGARLPAVALDAAPLNLRERIIASEQALQLDSLIGWIEAQAGVRTNP